MGLIVQKFGGWAVANQKRVLQSAKQVQAAVSRGDQVVVVVSAMGSQTDELQELADRYHSQPPAREVDVLLSSGERMTMALFSMTLDSLGVKAISLTGSQSGILTDGTHRNAKILEVKPYRVQEALDKGYVVVVAGFQGVSPISKDITTLGRGGSDLTAVALAVTLKANACQLYKGVNGFMTADPQQVSSAKNLSELSWDEACALAWSGAGILHHRGAELARSQKIPIELCALKDEGRTATRIGVVSRVESSYVKAVTQQVGQVKVSIKHASLLPLWSDLLKWLWEKGEHTLICRLEILADQQQGVLSVSLNFLDALQDRLKNIKAVVELQECSILTMVGSGFKSDIRLLNDVTKSLGGRALFLEVDDTTLRIGVRAAETASVLNMLHGYCVEAI
ncbi:MAG: aspartate kinase [Oligoflexales bacterium]